MTTLTECSLALASNQLTAAQVRNNSSTQASWKSARLHRERVTGLVSALAREDNASLCVLGAGNTNDIELPTLLAAYERVDLVDLDPEAVQRGISLQTQSTDRVGVLAPLDITGVWDMLASLKSHRNNDTAIDRVIERSASIGRSSLGLPAGIRYSTVVSTCLISQLLEAAMSVLGSAHPRLAELALTLRDAHLRIASGLVSPDGSVAIVVDFASSDTAPDLSCCPERQLPELLSRLINSGNFFTGLNPFRIAEVLRNSAESWGIDGTSVRVADPWRWFIGGRVFGVTAITFQKARQSAPACPS